MSSAASSGCKRAAQNLVLLLVAVLVAAALYATRQRWAEAVGLPVSTPASEKSDLSAELAAMRGVEAVLSVEAQDGEQAYIDRICAVASVQGCEIAANLYGRMLWASVEKNHSRTRCTALGASLVDETEQDEGHYRIYRVQTEMAELSTGEVESGTLYAQIEEEEGEWKFLRLLFDEESVTYEEQEQ